MISNILNCCSPNFGVICLTFWYPKYFLGWVTHVCAYPTTSLFWSLSFFRRQKAQTTTSKAIIHKINSTSSLELMFSYYFIIIGKELLLRYWLLTLCCARTHDRNEHKITLTQRK